MDIIKIGKEIKELEAQETTWQNVEKLAMLYCVYDHLNGETHTVRAQSVVDVMPECGIGEFEETCTGVPILKLIDILSEHMAVAKTLYPKEYQAVISRIKDIKGTPD